METVRHYVVLEWLEPDAEDEPVKFISELDEQRYDVRTVEVYEDGRCDYADAEHESGAFLSSEPYPEDNAVWEPEVRAYNITKEEFEDIWQRVTSQAVGEVFPDLAVFKTK